MASEEMLIAIAVPRDRKGQRGRAATAPRHRRNPTT
jgi:hypothetical protein